MIDEAKKVLIYEDDDGDFDGYRITRVEYGCPNCGHDLIQHEDRCPKCEQKLKW